MVKKFSIFILVLGYVCQNTDGSNVEHIGCHKVNLAKRCSLNSTDEEINLTAQVTKTLAKSIEWLRTQHVVETTTASWLMQSIVLSGYVVDNGQCSETLKNAMAKASISVKNINELSGGKLAIFMTGLKANCNYSKTFNKDVLVQSLKNKMKGFPKGEFNHFYQYSLGIIALYINGEDIPEEFGRTLLRGVFIGKTKDKAFQHKSKLISDTEALGLIALSALSQQKFTGHWVRKHALRELKKAEKKIDRILTGEDEEKNFVTYLHVLQVMDIKHKPYCRNVMNNVINKQNKHGFYGNHNGRLMTTSYVLSALSGRSILDLRDMECQQKQDNVDKVKIGEYIKKHATNIKNDKKKDKKKQKNIKVTVKVSFGIHGFSELKESVKIKILEGGSALNALSKASKRNPCFKYEAKDSSWGKYITKICNIEANHTKRTYWSFYINGKSANVGASSYKPKANDVILFKYRKF